MNEPSTVGTTSEANSADPRRHEPDTVRARLVSVSVIGLVLLVVFSLLLVHFVANRLLTTNPPGDSVRSLPAWREDEGLPDVMADQPQQLRELYERESQQLSSYEWIDKNAGLARIPIERAMEILAKRGFDTNPSSATETSDEPTSTEPTNE